MKISEKFLEMSAIYKHFAKNVSSRLDFSDSALEAMYRFETHGEPLAYDGLNNLPSNGFYWGKKWMDVQIANWRESIADGTFTKREIFLDNFRALPEAWLEKVLSDIPPAARGAADIFASSDIRQSIVGKEHTRVC